jgi:hypothetical protein
MSSTVSRPLRLLAQAALYGAFALAVGVFSSWPVFRQLDAEQALLRLSLLHSGKPRFECRTRSAEELEKMPKHMRTPLDCPRERSPVRVQVEFDGRIVIDETVAPGGLTRDGAAAIYRRMAVPVGAHQLRVRVNDDSRRQDFPFEHTQALQLAAGQVVLIDFNPDRGGVIVR